MVNKQRYDLYLSNPTSGLIKAAEAVLLEEYQRPRVMGFRYTPDYLAQPDAFPLDPVHLPLSGGERQLACLAGLPGILDDYLPDDWGRKVLAQLAFYRDQQKLNSHSAIDMLALLGESRVGALRWVAAGEKPAYGLGSSMEKLAQAETAAQSVDDPSAYPEQLDELSLLYLANAGTGVGGARPKALLHENGEAFLAKFNRLQGDSYNSARVELACLRMAAAAGLQVGDGRVVEGINGREVLLLNRFDVLSAGRLHLISVNALLKDSNTMADKGDVFRYDDIAELCRRYSAKVERDLHQLLAQMLFNRAINNTDDHERNFSLVCAGEGYQLSPAYDMVPSLTRGAYHAAGFRYSPSPPTIAEVPSLGKIFGLPKTDAARIAERVAEALRQWPAFAEAASVSAEDCEKVQAVIRLS